MCAACDGHHGELFTAFLEVLGQEAGKVTAVDLARDHMLLDLALVHSSAKSAIDVCANAVMGERARLHVPSENANVREIKAMAAAIRRRHAGLKPVDGRLHLSAELMAYTTCYCSMTRSMGMTKMTHHLKGPIKPIKPIKPTQATINIMIQRQLQFVGAYLDGPGTMPQWTHLDVCVRIGTAGADSCSGYSGHSGHPDNTALVMPMAALQRLLTASTELQAVKLRLEGLSMYSCIGDIVVEGSQLRFIENLCDIVSMLSSEQRGKLRSLEVIGLTTECIESLARVLQELPRLTHLAIETMSGICIGEREFRVILKHAPAGLAELRMSPLFLRCQQSYEHYADGRRFANVQTLSLCGKVSGHYGVQHDAEVIAEMFPALQRVHAGIDSILVSLEQHAVRWQTLLTGLGKLDACDSTVPVVFDLRGCDAPVLLRDREFPAVSCAAIETGSTADSQSSACCLSSLLAALPCLEVLELRSYRSRDLAAQTRLLQVVMTSLPRATAVVRVILNRHMGGVPHVSQALTRMCQDACMCLPSDSTLEHITLVSKGIDFKASISIGPPDAPPDRPGRDVTIKCGGLV